MTVDLFGLLLGLPSLCLRCAFGAPLVRLANANANYRLHGQTSPNIVKQH